MTFDEWIQINKGNPFFTKATLIPLKDAWDSGFAEGGTRLWISCKDRMPEDGVTVLFWEGDLNVGWYRKEENDWLPDWAPTTIGTKHVTHWMPAPPNPELD